MRMSRRWIWFFVVATTVEPVAAQQPANLALGQREIAAELPTLERPAGLSVRRVGLQDALTILSRVSGVPVTFSPTHLPVGMRVTCDCREMTLREVLEQLLKDTRLEYHVVEEHVVIVDRLPPRRIDRDPGSGIMPARLVAANLRSGMGELGADPLGAPVQGTITGQVTSVTTGEPIAGASIAVVGTGSGSLSGADGRYTIAGVPAGVHQVQATRVGYAPQARSVTISSGQSITLNFALQDQVVMLEGVVAVGYGTQLRRDVTGSVASVSPGRLEDLPHTSVAQALQGSAPGVSILTTTAGAEPRHEIQIRGQNSIKASNAPLIVVDGIPYNGNLAEINANDVASIDVLKDASAGAIYGARGANGVILISTHKGRAGRPTFSYEGYVGVQEIANKPRLMNGEEFAAFKCERLKEYVSCDEALVASERAKLAEGRFTDWLDLATRRGYQQQHTLALSGGSEDTRYYLSGSALDTEGVAVNDQFQRYTMRLNLDQQIGSRVNLGVSTQMSQADRSGLPASFSGAFNSTPLENAFNEDGSIALYPLPEDPQRTNPLQNLNVIDDDVSRRLLLSGYGEVQLPAVEGLSFRVNAGIDHGTRNVGRYFGRNTRPGLDNQGRAITQADRNFDWTLENVVRFARDIGAHRLDFTALYSAQAYDREFDALTAQGFPNDVLTYRQTNVARSLNPTHDVQRSGLVSQMGRVNYGYDGRYLITLTGRRDGFSGFGQNYKYGIFPSIALAWNASEEPFWNHGTVNSLKIRFSFGQNGNQAILPYQTLAQLAERSSVDAGTSWPGFIPATLGNENLRWETTTSMNAGADFALFQNRLSGTLDAYSSQTHDLLLDRLVSPVHGIPQMVENIGRVRNRGVELSLSGSPLETSRFLWRSDFNISANRNQIVDLYGDRTDDILNQWFIGQSINTNFGYVFDGVWQVGDDIANSAQPTARPGDTRVRDVNGDGKVDAADRTFLGTADPSYTAGINNMLQFGNLSLDFFVHAVQGVQRYNELILADVAGGAAGSVRNNALLFTYWTPENPINTRWANREGANVFGAGQHDLGVGVYDDASFVRLRDVTLSYDLPNTLAGRIGAGTLRVFVSGRNLWTHTNWIGLDPELSTQRAIPLERLFTIGIRGRF